MLITSNENITSEVDLFIVENRENLLNIREQSIREFFTMYMYSNLENFSYTKSFEYGNAYLIFTGVIFKDNANPYMNFKADYRFVLANKNVSQDRQNEYNAQVSKLLYMNFLFEKIEVEEAYRNDKNLFEYLCDNYKRQAKKVADNLVKTSYKCIINTNSSIKYSTFKTDHLKANKNIPVRSITTDLNIITNPDRFVSVFMNIKFFLGSEPITDSINYTGENISLLCNETLTPDFAKLTEKKTEDLEDQVYENANFIEKLLIQVSYLFGGRKKANIHCI